MMKLSFTLGPRVSFASDCAAAKRLGADGVVIDPADTDSFEAPAVLRAAADAGLTISGLRWRLEWAGGSDSVFSACVQRAIDVASELSCRFVSPLLGQSQVGRTASSAGAAFRDSLGPLEERARSCGMRLLLGNDGLFATARQLWAVLDQLPRDTFGCDWDLGRGQRRGDTPAVAVPMLNLRLACVDIEPGSDDRMTSHAIHRLAGIGYGGWVNFMAGTVALEGDRFAIAAATIRRRIDASSHSAAQKKTPASVAGDSTVAR